MKQPDPSSSSKGATVRAHLKEAAEMGVLFSLSAIPQICNVFENLLDIQKSYTDC
jgi:hypothetical protein